MKTQRRSRTLHPAGRRLGVASPGTASSYAPGTHPDLPPPVRTTGFIGWARQNLFSSPFNVVLTLLGVWVLYALIPPFVEWAFVKSVWVADTRNECWDKMEVPEGAACWAFIKAKVNLFIYGFYPLEERWRAHLSFLLLVLAIIPVLYDRMPGRKHWMWYVAVFPFLTGWLLVGGFGPSCRGIRSDRRFPADPRYRGDRHLVLAPHRHRPRPRANLRHARGAHAVCALHRVHSGGAAHHPALRRVDDAQLLPAARHDVRPAHAGAHHGHPVLVGLHRGGGPGGAPGNPAGPGGGGGLARPLLLECAAAHRPPPGAQDLDPRHRQHLHRALQGHHPGARDRHARPPRHRPLGPCGRGVGGARAGDVPLHRGVLLPVLLRDVALLALPRGQARHEPRE